MKLAIPISINCLLVLAVYLADKYTPAKKLPYVAKQIIIGLLFGAVSAFSSSYGVEVLETVANVRDAAPITAGLIFGGPAGIIAGFIGGIYRWVSVAWGAGTYTQLACTIATILAGFMAAAVRNLLFDNKKPTWGYGICIAVVCEVVHMMLIFGTNISNPYDAFGFVKGATIPMLIGNSIAVSLSIILVSVLSHEKLTRKKANEQIAQTFQRGLLFCIIIAYIVTGLFNFVLQNGMAQIETEKVFSTAITDVKTDVRTKSDIYLLDIVSHIKSEYEANPDVSLAALSEEYDIEEINIIANDGTIINSTDKSYIDAFNMNDTDQSREFLYNLENNNSYVQEYGPMGMNPSILRKYAASTLSDGGYIQIGLSADQFHIMLDEFVVDVTKNRHVGTNGFVAVCDEKLNMVTHDAYNGKHISAIGIEPNEQMLNKQTATELGETTIINIDNNYAEEYVYAFTFVEGYCIVATIPKAEAMFMRDASFYTSLFMQVIVFATLFVFIYILIKRVIINNLRKINSTLGQITNGNLNLTVDVRSNEEFSSLSDDINSTVSTLKQYISEAAARIDKELEYAKQIQLSALPTNYPNTDEYEIYAQMIAAKEVGGDFYDIYKINDNTVAFLAADVSGKGIPAAMFMMTAKTIIKDLAESGLPVNEVLTRANEKLCENNESGMFVTAWMGILDISTGRLTYANAGHNPPLLKKANGDFEYLKSRAGFVLAGMEGIKYRLNELELETGDRLFLYTDGVTEATNTENELYGEERLLAFMNESHNVTAKELLPALKESIDEFVGEAPQFDDITMLIFDYKSGKGEINSVSRSFPAKTESLNDVIDFIEETLEGYECSMKVQTAVCVAIEEVFVNVANYAYGDGEGDVGFEISFDGASRNATFRMSDKGVPFDPLKKPDPDISLSAEDRDIGGLGIFITKKTMDSITYAYENGENVLTMIKKI